MRYLILLLLSALLQAGCSALPSAREREAHATGLASSEGWLPSPIPVGGFDLVAYAPPSLAAGELLTVYIEGDGFAWISGHQPSSDPTPRDPLALRLALAQPAGHAVYLARPCQYVNAAQSGCAQRYWTEARFAPEVIDAMNLAIGALKQRFNANQLVLVGYSGGAAVAALVAARRTDVARLITVAGNLDHKGVDLSPPCSAAPCFSQCRRQRTVVIRFAAGAFLGGQGQGDTARTGPQVARGLHWPERQQPPDRW